jgi:hypothetical protein
MRTKRMRVKIETFGLTDTTLRAINYQLTGGCMPATRSAARDFITDGAMEVLNEAVGIWENEQSDQEEDDQEEDDQEEDDHDGIY